MKLQQRTLCVVTGTRAEYGLLKHLMQAINESQEFKLQIIATGMHLSKKHGNTYKEIEADGFTINQMVDISLSADTPLAIAKSTALGLTGIAEAYSQLKPDLVIILGDRFEILAAAVAALFARIPIAHLHGGELTEGAMDDAMRHAITKCAHLHFVATEVYKRRVIQLGENPNHVFNVGGLGVDGITQVKLMTRQELEKDLGFTFRNKNVLITYHPVTLEENTSAMQMNELLAALADLEETQLIFTMPNADMDSDIISVLIKEFVMSHPNSCFFTSLGQWRYLSCMAQVDGIIGNSSSGLTEAPTFKKATINIGDRQKGRIQAGSIINCAPDRRSIATALADMYHDDFQKKLVHVVNPYGNGGAVKQIMAILQSTSLSGLIKKGFYDLEF